MIFLSADGGDEVLLSFTIIAAAKSHGECLESVNCPDHEENIHAGYACGLQAVNVGEVA
jgi:hypothetical protein